MCICKNHWPFSVDTESITTYLYIIYVANDATVLWSQPCLMNRLCITNVGIMAQSNDEVIELLDSSDDDHDDDGRPPKEKNSEDDHGLVLVAVLPPPHGETKGKKRLPVTINNPYLKSDSRPTRKRPRTSLSDETVVAGVSLIVKIDKDGSDYGHALPGRLPPQYEWICSNDTSKILQFVGQKDDWSCGYRNLQMLLSALLPHLPEDHLFHTKYPRRSGHIAIPSLYQIQSAIENAWQDGFDPEMFHWSRRGAFGIGILGHRCDSRSIHSMSRVS
jgi:hypothetical protein